MKRVQRTRFHLNNVNKGLTGEFYALAQLTARGLTATLTLGNAKGVDIFVRNPKGKLFQVEAKTTTHIKPVKDLKMFGDVKNYVWIMRDSAEGRMDENLVYIFMLLDETKINLAPRFFIVPGPTVTEHITSTHQYYLEHSKKANKSRNTMRKFRIPEDDPDGYENNWKILC